MSDIEMSDIDLIKLLWKLLCDDLTDGDMPSKGDLKVILHELFVRGIIEEEEFPH